MPIAGPTTDHAEIRYWAQQHQAVPTEILPQQLDHEPSTLRIMLPQMAATQQNIRVLTWEEFFIKFDLLGLTFVYDTDRTGYNELLQVEAKNPYRNESYQPVDRRN